MTSVITPSFGLMRGTNVHAREGVPSGRERFPIRLGIIEEGHRLEPVAACPAMPEIRRAARAGFNPVRGGDRLAALGAGIFVGQIAEVCSGHGATPFCFLLLEGELDRFAVGYRCSVLSLGIVEEH